jgi:hypothetical protein
MAHWTQTPAGRRRMSQIMKAKYRKGWRQKKQKKPTPQTTTASDAFGDHKWRFGEVTTAAPTPNSAKTMARHEVADLAIRGAITKLADLEREIEKLRMFIGKRGGGNYVA